MRAPSRALLWTSSLALAASLLLAAASSLAASDSVGSPADSAPASWSRPSHWIASLVREYFSDIDWDKIDEAREQVEKFVHRFERLLNFRPSGLHPAPSNASSKAADDAKARVWSWWIAAPKNASTGSLHEALDRVACFVGYLKLLNESEQMIAELDSSGVLSNLFAASGKKPNWLSTLWG